MATEADILAEIEELGRLTEEQENILYNLTLKQEELGRQSTNLFLDKVLGSEVYQPMIDREMITYEVFNHGTKHEVASLYVTLKGMRYCIMHSDELSGRRKMNPAGAPWETTEANKQKYGL